jgi:type II restriction/modification system DNA methylase subunit YeeA
VPEINANLTGGRSDLTKARRLKENLGISFMGDTKVGPFDIPEAMAKKMLAIPNPNRRPNSDVVRPWVNGLDVTRRPREMWIIDFPPGMSEQDAARYEAPYEHVRQRVKPERLKNKRSSYATRWWTHGEPRPEMRAALSGLARYLATPILTKHRFFVWLNAAILPDHQLIVFARDDDFTFGVLQSRVHTTWALRMGTQLENRPRYTPTSCFETFPFPKPAKGQRAVIENAAKELNDLREAWLNPTQLISDKDLKARTLTNLYNKPPAWLENAIRALDDAVLAAYGWADNPGDADILARLLDLNLQREPAD